MLIHGKGANEITVEDIEDFLNGDGATTPVANEDESSPATQPNADQSGSDDTQDGAQDGVQTEVHTDTKPGITETQAFARRLREETSKVRNEERESIARSMGYESYDAMQKAHQDNLLKQKGLDPEEVSPVVEQIVQQRLAEDPRLKEFDAFRQQRVTEWARGELAELAELTEGRISTFKDVPKHVLELWKTKGSLKAAYLELEGETLIRQMRASIASGQSKGSTRHLNSPQGTPAPAVNPNRRPLTAQERDVYRLFNPDVTDEELSKMYKDN